MSFAVRILGVQVRASARSLWRTPLSTASYSTATAALPTTCALSNNYSCSASSSSFSSSSSSFSLPSRSCLHTTQRRWMADDKGTPEAGSRAEAEALFGGPDGRPMGGGGSPGGGRQGARYQASAAHSANILESSGPQVNRVSSYSPAGFTVNDTRMQGAVALFPGLQLMWKVQVMEDITIESLELFVRMNPKIDVLVLGSGDRIEFVYDMCDHYHIPQTLMLTFALPTYDVIYQRPPPIREYLKQYGITIEVQDTRRACATYNFLSEEGRRVAGALLPPTVARPKPRMWSPTSNSTGQF